MTEVDKSTFKKGQTKQLNPSAADTEGLTSFYTSLYKQRPESEMAARFLLQHGLLPEEDIEKTIKRFNIKGGGGASSSKSGGGGSSSKKAKVAKAIVTETHALNSAPLQRELTRVMSLACA